MPSTESFSKTDNAALDPMYALVPALSSGACQAICFNPIDRALYLSVHNRRPVLHHCNWMHPFHGFGNAAVHRTVASGMYLFWSDEARQALHHHLPAMAARPVASQLLVGASAGAVNSLLLNSMQVVKFRMWSTSGTFRDIAREMYRDAGPKIFMRGVGVSVARDATFGMAYEALRNLPQRPASRREQFVLDASAAAAASVLSSPLNYCRNVVYGAPTLGCPLRVPHLLLFMVQESMARPTWAGRLKHLNSRLNVGWGSVRVGVGMGIGQMLFGCIKGAMVVAVPPEGERRLAVA
jgi:hypothetical protein